MMRGSNIVVSLCLGVIPTKEESITQQSSNRFLLRRNDSIERIEKEINVCRK